MSAGRDAAAADMAAVRARVNAALVDADLYAGDLADRLFTSIENTTDRLTGARPLSSLDLAVVAEASGVTVGHLLGTDLPVTVRVCHVDETVVPDVPAAPSS